MRHPRGETVVVHPYVLDGGRDDYNNPVPGWGADVPRPYCAVAPRVEEEDAGGHNRTMIVEGFDVYDTYDSPVTAYDEVTVRGTRYKVDGEVARWRNPFVPGPDGTHFKVKRVNG